MQAPVNCECIDLQDEGEEPGELSAVEGEG
jgi:hypothetical protein